MAHAYVCKRASNASRVVSAAICTSAGRGRTCASRAEHERVVQRVREGMQSGRYPGARKIDGLIQMPLEALAEILDPAPAPQPVAPIITPSSSRRRSAIGPRLGFVRAAGFWEQVMGAIGDRNWPMS